MKLSVTAKTTIAIIISGTILVLIGNLANEQGNLHLANTGLVNDTQRYLDQVDAIYSGLGDLEIVEHDLLTNPTKENARRYERVSKHIRDMMTQFEPRTMPSRAQEERVVVENALHRLKVSRDFIKCDKNSPDYERLKANWEDTSRELAHNIRAQIQSLKTYQNNNLNTNNEQLQLQTVNDIFLINFLMLIVFSIQMIIWTFVVRYVSERQKVEENLLDREARMRAVVDTAPDGIITVADGGTIESSNSAMHNIFGYTSEELVGTNVTTIISDFYANDQVETFTKKLSTGQSEITSKDKEVEGRRKDGSTVPLSLATSILNLGDKQIITAIVRDISERKEAEKRVSDFYSTVSHELRTPLTSIRTALGLMESGSAGKLAGKATQLIRIARSECDRLIRLINDILDIRKIESGKLQLKLQTTEPETLIDITFNGLENIAKEAHVELVADVAETTIRCDVDRMVQVLTNLISNAIRFSPQGSQVTVKGARISAGKIYRMEVIDNGPGIPEDQLHKLWDRFQQLDSSDGNSKGGSGLGLAITKAIVTEHGGTVGVESEVGKGSKFWFQLQEAGNEQPLTVPSVPEGRLRILVVDDDEEVLDLLNGLMSSSGYDFTCARSVTEATRLLAERRPTIVLVNVQLPDGFDLIRALALRDGPDPLPVVMLPGRDPETHTLGNPLLFDWLIKPRDANRLREVLQSASKHHLLNDSTTVIVSDDRDTERKLQEQLLELKVRTARNAELTLPELVKESSPDFVLLDIDSSQQLCFDTFQVLRQETLQTVPIILYADRELASEDLDKLTLACSRYVSRSHMTESEFLTALRQLLDGRIKTAATAVAGG